MTRKFKEKLVKRNDAIAKAYRALINAGGDLYESKVKLAKTYGVTVATIYNALKDAKERAYNEAE